MRNSNESAVRSARFLPTLVATFAVVVSVFVASPAVAEQEVPKDVMHFFEADARDAIARILSEQKTLETFGDLAIVSPRLGAPTQVHRFTEAFVAGEDLESIAEPLEEWVAPLYEEGRIYGTLVAWRDPALGGEVALAYYNDDIVIAEELTAMAPGERLVADPFSSTYLAVEGETVRPLGLRLREMLGDALSAKEYQERLAEFVANIDEEAPDGGMGMVAAGSTQPPGARTAMQVGGAGLMLAGVFLFIVDRRRRREA